MVKSLPHEELILFLAVLGLPHPHLQAAVIHLFAVLGLPPPHS